MLNFDCFKCDFVIFGIGNEYQDVYADLYKLKSDFSGYFYIIMGIARTLQSVVSSTILFMYRSLLGFENRVK